MKKLLSDTELCCRLLNKNKEERANLLLITKIYLKIRKKNWKFYRKKVYALLLLKFKKKL